MVGEADIASEAPVRSGWISTKPTKSAKMSWCDTFSADQPLSQMPKVESNSSVYKSAGLIAGYDKLAAGAPATSRLGLRLTPLGRLLLDATQHAPILDDKVAERLAKAFAQGSGYGLMRLGAVEVGQSLPPVFVWWRDFAASYVGALCVHSSGATGDARSSPTLPVVPLPTVGELAALLLTAPMMPGAEYLTADVMLALWAELSAAFAASLTVSGTDLQDFLRLLNPAWNLLGRVHFNLAENRRDPEHPFAFMASYTTRLSAQGKAQHLPLGQAMREYSGLANRDKLLSLLTPVQRAAETCNWLRSMVDAGEIFHPLRWTPAEAARFLASAPLLESAGIVLRMPAAWRANRPARPQVAATVGARAPSALGLDGLLDFRMEVTLEGEVLNNEEIHTLLAGTETLVLLRGVWVEIDSERLERAMRQFKEAEALAKRDGLTFAEAMRLLAGATLTDDAADPVAADWAGVTAGPWLEETLKTLRTPQATGVDLGAALNGTLRPYQKAGVQWLHLLSGLGLGACLADDMGLGKTIQVLALLLAQVGKDGGRRSSLLVAPASLLVNWADEIARFAPTLNAAIIHPSAMTAEQVKQITPDRLQELDLAITSYGSLLRMPALTRARWQFVILVVDPEGGHWVRFVVTRVPASPEKPHGLDYSLTLHGPDGERLVGFDNAHPVAQQKRGEPQDHRHRLRTIKAYDYRDAATLLGDFWTTVDAVLRERGVIP